MITTPYSAKLEPLRLNPVQKYKFLSGEEQPLTIEKGF